MATMPILPSNLPAVRDAKLPAVYESARTALAECSRVDECKDWADKAAALASYARQADDDTLEKTAMRIRARAIRRCGELLREIEPKPGRPPKESVGAPPPISRKTAAAEAGLSRDQAITAVRVARVPELEFEEAVEAEDPPTVEQLAERGKKPAPKPLVDLGGRDPKEFSISTNAQGRLRDLAQVAVAVQPAVMVRGALPHEYQAIGKNAVEVLDWCRLVLTELEQHE